MSCNQPKCRKQAKVRGMCSMHYARWRRHGDPNIVKLDMSLRSRSGLTDGERLLARCKPQPNGCLEWQGYTQRGYGRMRLADSFVLAHRLSYEMYVGPIPDGKQIDHLCFNPPCVNPDHLEVVTPRENQRRRALKNRSEWTTCQSGKHPYPENRVLEPSSGRYRCLLCRREAQRRYKAKRRRPV